MNPVRSQIIGSFEDIGEQILKTTVKIPGEIAGKALESLGASQSSTGKTQTSNKVLVGSADATTKDQWDQIEGVKDNQIKQAVARAALEALTKRPKAKDPSVWEKIQAENDRKKEAQAQTQALAAATSLPHITAKRPAGDLYGLKAKRSTSEIGKNVKSE